MNYRVLRVCGLGVALLPGLSSGPRAWAAPDGYQLASSGTTSINVGRMRVPSTVYVKFDGQLVSGSTVDSLVNDSVIDWGPVLDDDNHNVDGEIWVVVRRNDRAVFYHLTEEPASGTGSYSGYTVVSKGIFTQRFLNYGYGEEVAVIGDDTAAFV